MITWVVGWPALSVLATAHVSPRGPARWSIPIALVRRTAGRWRYTSENTTYMSEMYFKTENQRPTWPFLQSRLSNKERKADYQCDDTWDTKQIEEGHNIRLMRKPFIGSINTTLPPVITLGGGHSIMLPLLRKINRARGPILWRLFILIASCEKSMDDRRSTKQVG
ncbi:hypothetical protein N7455_004654 [Penicillium solitum]|uniref:uncharacterized protein n=1 Tax=Penicillium solitum TaxID=60172 RepID=UPI0032C42AAF|nr:hypothetical protein N7455_004654 [Penicillium solitum]